MYLVFLVDDDPDDHKFFQLAVSDLPVPIRCEFAYSGMEAIEILKNQLNFNPDFIFIDINMPVMSGLECLREIKKIERLQHIPVYMYSTSAEENITSSYIFLGAAGVIKKVPSIKSLKEVLREIFVQPH